MPKDRLAELKAIRDQARADAERAEDAIETFARQARKRMRNRGRRLPSRSPPQRSPSESRRRCVGLVLVAAPAPPLATPPRFQAPV